MKKRKSISPGTPRRQYLAPAIPPTSPLDVEPLVTKPEGDAAQRLGFVIASNLIDRARVGRFQLGDTNAALNAAITGGGECLRGFCERFDQLMRALR